MSSDGKLRLMHLLAAVCAFATAGAIGHGATGLAALFGGMTGFIAGTLRALAIAERVLSDNQKS